MIRLSELKLNEANPRVIKDDKFKKLVESIKSFPQMMELRPIVVDEMNVIQGGNMRYRALVELGYQDVPDEWVKQGKELTPEQWREFVIKDNVGFGEWDFDMLANDWDAEELQEWGMDFPEFEAPEEEAEAKDDNYEIPEEIETDIIEGDFFEIGSHRLICGDSTKAEAYEKMMQEKTADLVITDPPYNVDYGQKAKMLGDYDKGHRNVNKIQNDNMSSAAFLEFLSGFYQQVANTMKPGASIYVFHAESSSTEFRSSFQKSGLDLKQCLIWVKNSMVMGRQDYQWKHEPILYGWKPGAAHYFVNDRTNTTVIDDKLNLKKLSKNEMLKLLQEIYSEKTPTTVIYHDKPQRNDVHPTMKPVTLIGYLMQNSSKPLQIVSDPFLGSGSTMVAAHQLKRRCYGIELDPKYCQVIIDRMLKLDPTIKIKRNGEDYERQKANIG